MRIFKILLTAVLCIALLLGGAVLWMFKGTTVSNPRNYATIGDIPTPSGYERIDTTDGYAHYLRSLPLKEKGSKVMLYSGGIARFQTLNYAVVDLPLISNDEQCADMCMRLRAEYLYNSGQTRRIHFNNVNGRRMDYAGGYSRKAFERYLRKVYGVASTLSLSREMKVRKLKDMKPGDVFVYSGAERGQKMGHAVTVVDVAQNKHGNKVFMLAEGNTPARELHVVSNWLNPFRSPWFTLDEDAKVIQLSPFTYFPRNLKCWDAD